MHRPIIHSSEALKPPLGKTHMHTCVRTHTEMHTCMHTHAHTCMHTHAHTQMHTCAHMHTHAHARAQMRTCTHRCTHRCTHVHSHTCTHTHSCTHAHTAAHTHTHTYTCTPRPLFSITVLHKTSQGSPHLDATLPSLANKVLYPLLSSDLLDPSLPRPSVFVLQEYQAAHKFPNPMCFQTSVSGPCSPQMLTYIPNLPQTRPALPCSWTHRGAVHRHPPPTTPAESCHPIADHPKVALDHQ